jgi:Tfp pilus assembly protein PilV
MIRPRRGATVLELLVALLLFNLVLLALVTANAVVARRVGDATRRQRALTAAANRFESQLAFPCAAPSQSATVGIEQGVQESWSASTAGSTREIVDSVQIRNRPAVVVRGSRVC